MKFLRLLTPSMSSVLIRVSTWLTVHFRPQPGTAWKSDTFPSPSVFRVCEIYDTHTCINRSKDNRVKTLTFFVIFLFISSEYNVVTICWNPFERF